MTVELKSVGLDFPRWQDALEAAYSSGRLFVSGEVRGGQVLQYDDPSGSRLVVLAVEPFGTFASFWGGVATSGHLSMVNDIVGVIDVVDDSPALQIAAATAPTIASLTANIVQGPMLADAEALEYQPVELSALAVDVEVFTDAALVATAGYGAEVGVVHSLGLEDLNNPQVADHAGARIVVEVLSISRRTCALSGADFWVGTVHAPFPFSVTIPDTGLDLAAATIGPDGKPRPLFVAGNVQFTANVAQAPGCGGGGCGSGSCGCGGH